MICYPMGLPEWDFVRQCLEEREDLSGSDVSVGPGSCCLAARLPVGYRTGKTVTPLPPPTHTHSHHTYTLSLNPQFGGEDFDPANCQLWFASRALDPAKPLSEYLVSAATTERA